MSDQASLSQRLGRYGIVARGQLSRSRSIGDIAGYATAAGAALVMAGGAEAQIIYSGVQNISTAIDPTLTTAGSSFANAAPEVGIDLDGGGEDVFLRVEFDGVRKGAMATTATYYGIGANIAAFQGALNMLGTGASAGLGAYRLPPHFYVGAGGNFAAGSAGLSHGQRHIGSSLSGGFSVGDFPLGVSGFVGFQLANGHYGWIRLRVEELGPNNPFSGQSGNHLPGAGYPDKITVIDWAYEDSGAAIGTPAPTPLALLAAGALGIAAFRRRRARLPAG